MIINIPMASVEASQKVCMREAVMEKREDRRVAMTKRMLKDALIEMLKEKDIYHISIRELCEKADVNRTTFYKYYSSQFDLLADMEKDLIDFISKLIERSESDPGEIIAAACRYLEENLSFVRLIVNNNVDPDFANKLLAMDNIKSSTLKNIGSKRSEAEMEYIYSFLTYGAYRMICVWLNKEQREPPEIIAGFFNQLMLSIANNLKMQ
jgi:AcrR family transcriptional regulator